MKKITNLFCVILFFYCGIVASQQMVQTTNDVYKLKENEEQFINKPLKNLLKEIRPEIKIVYPSNDPSFYVY